VARGNENGAHRPDDVYYLGAGTTSGYAVCNVTASYRVARGVQIYLEADNVFDRRYATAAQLGPAAFTTAGTFLARPYPAINGEFPVTHTTFLAPGPPRFVAAGLRVAF
jgi:outer membrane receptor protein involved in Fe transport